MSVYVSNLISRKYGIVIAIRGGTARRAATGKIQYVISRIPLGPFPALKRFFLYCIFFLNSGHTIVKVVPSSAEVVNVTLPLSIFSPRSFMEYVPVPLPSSAFVLKLR